MQALALQYDVQTFLQTDNRSRHCQEPQIQSEQKIEVIQNCFEGQVDDQIEAFMEIIIKAGRQAEMMKIFDYFLKQVKAYKHIGTAYVTSAKELTERQKLAIEARLLELTDFISFEMVYQTDPSLIGGMVIRIGDKVVDSSIKTKLENMSKELTFCLSGSLPSVYKAEHNFILNIFQPVSESGLHHQSN